MKKLKLRICNFVWPFCDTAQWAVLIFKFSLMNQVRATYLKSGYIHFSIFLWKKVRDINTYYRVLKTYFDFGHQPKFWRNEFENTLCYAPKGRPVSCVAFYQRASEWGIGSKSEYYPVTPIIRDSNLTESTWIFFGLWETCPTWQPSSCFYSKFGRQGPAQEFQVSTSSF